MMDAAYLAWAARRRPRAQPILIADNAATVRDLNVRAQAERIAAHGATSRST
jgi:hypothetical protein